MYTPTTDIRNGGGDIPVIGMLHTGEIGEVDGITLTPSTIHTAQALSLPKYST